MDHFNYVDAHLHAEQVDLAEIATQVGTPCYVYSRATLERHWHAFDAAFGSYPHQICYAVKANSNLAILDILARLGSGFDIVSGGELVRVVEAGGDPARTVFSGVCKLDWEIRLALEHGVGCFNVETEGELARISRIAEECNVVAGISVRINPDVDPATHPYISTGLKQNKFGVSPDQAMAIYRDASTDQHIEIKGVACHIGSQLTNLSPYRDALERVLSFVGELEREGIVIEHIDFGGGLGVRYSDEEPPSPLEYVEAIIELLGKHGRQYPVTVEPGRAIAGNAGILLTRVQEIKHGDEASFCIVDAAMNDLIRPALYQAYQEIVEVETGGGRDPLTCDVVGPVCESGDFLGKDRTLSVREGDLLAVRTSGAYSAVMSSNYNSRPRPAEVLVDGDRYHVVKERESLEALYAGESRLP